VSFRQSNELETIWHLSVKNATDRA
jgi:hypothetical protein